MCISGLADYVDRNRKLFSKMNAVFLSLVSFFYFICVDISWVKFREYIFHV
jgi:hypothetical protein